MRGENMKKIIMIWAALTLLLQLAACGEQDKPSEKRITAAGMQTSQQTVESIPDKKWINIYFNYINDVKTLKSISSVQKQTVEFPVSSLWYFIDDINYDGVADLVITNQQGKGTGFKIYTYKNNNVEILCESDMPYSAGVETLSLAKYKDKYGIFRHRDDSTGDFTFTTIDSNGDTTPVLSGSCDLDWKINDDIVSSAEWEAEFSSIQSNVSYWSFETFKSQADQVKTTPIPQAEMTARAKVEKSFKELNDRKNNPSAYLVPDGKCEGSIIPIGANEELLSYIRNEIYARHGYIFKTEPYKSYFESKTWYLPNPNFSENDFSESENQLLQHCQNFEDMVKKYHTLPEIIQNNLRPMAEHLGNEVFVFDIKEKDRFYQIALMSPYGGPCVVFAHKNSDVIYDWNAGDLSDYEIDEYGFYGKCKDEKISGFQCFSNIIKYAEENNIKLAKYICSSNQKEAYENYNDARKENYMPDAIHSFHVDSNTGEVTMIK